MIFTHPLLQTLPHIRHGFFSRKNGHSTDIYGSLNCGYGTHDNPNNVKKNYDFVCDNMQTPQCLTLKQIHSNKVITVTESWDLDNRPEADAMVTNLKNLSLGVLTADCGPLILADKTKNIIGTAHLGRKGVFSGLLFHTINAMVALGAKKSNIVAVLGPTISKINYEVGREIFINIMDRLPEYRRHIHIIRDKPSHYLLDLPAIIQQQAQSAGVIFADLKQCTYADQEHFFSFRRSTHQHEEDFGRLISTISLK